MLCHILCYIVAKSLFYANYGVLSRNLFCRYLRALAWRKIEPKILSMEKKGQISGMEHHELTLFESPPLSHPLKLLILGPLNQHNFIQATESSLHYSPDIWTNYTDV